MEKFFEEGELSREEIISGLNNGILGGDITPVCRCAAQPNIGVCTLMDNLVKYMPPASMAKAPKAVNPKTGDAVEVKQDGKFAAQVIKTVIDQFGKYSILKVYSGVLSADVAPYNTREEKSEKPSAPGIMRGKKVTPVDKLIAGDIGVLSKLQYTATGDTLCDASAPVQFEAIKFLSPASSWPFPPRSRAKKIRSLPALTSCSKKIQPWPSRRMPRPATCCSAVWARCILMFSAQS